MTTGKLFTNPLATHHTTIDEKPYIPVNFLRNTGNTGGKIKPHDKDNTRLHEISLLNNTYLGAIQYDVHLDMKLDYTKSRIVQEMS